MRKRKVILSIIGAIVLLYGGFVVLVRPSNDRAWTADQAVLPEVTMSGGMVAVRNIRNVAYRSVSDFTPEYYDATFDLQDLERVWYGVEPFAGQRPGLGHTFVSFEFSDDRFLVVSVEIRKEIGESFKPFNGLFRRYELIYVIADERDVIGLRANHRKDDVFLYPLMLTPEETRAMFLSMMGRAQETAAYPEFYNTLMNNCTTNVADAINAARPGTVPYLRYGMIMPAFSDAVFLERGLIDGNDIDAVRARYRINDAAATAEPEDFSVDIRS